MGIVARTASDAEADAFFAQFVDATPETVERIAGERGGNLAAIAAEDRAFGYWNRKMAARAARRAQQDREATSRREQRNATAASTRTADERARLTPPLEHTAVTLPEPRFVILTDPEYNATRKWWHRLENPTAARSLARRIRNEVNDAKRTQRCTARETTAWRDEQRAFERAQWKAVIANRNTRPQRKIANQWIAIDEDRALAIALAALTKTNPPQER